MYAERIRHLIWKAKEVAKTEGESTEYVDKVTEQSPLNRFKNNSHPDMARFLRTKGVKTFDEAVKEALEEERQIRPAQKSKYCTICKMSNHNTSECRKKKLSTQVCTYCKITGHHISECWKKSYFDK